MDACMSLVDAVTVVCTFCVHFASEWMPVCH